MGESSPSIHQLSHVDHVLQNFTPAWFTICMDTGIIALLLHQLPYQFPGLKIISTVLFILNIILYVIFMIVFLSRLFRHPRHTMQEFGSKAGELAGLTCPVVSFLTIQAMFSVTTGQAWGHSWAVAGYVLWWIGAFLSLAVLFSSFYISSRNAHFANSIIVPNIMLPLIGVLTSATNGGLMINFSPITARMAVPVIITGYLYLGMGVFLAFIILPHFVYHNLTHGFSKASMHNPAEILLIGPPGQAAAGFLSLGLAAQRDFGQYAKGTFLQSSAGMGLYSASVLLALLLLGLSFILGLMTFVRLAENVRLWKFSLARWASIFPFGVNINVLISLSVGMDSPAFRVLATAFTLVLVIAWLILAPLTLLNIRTLLKLPHRRKTCHPDHS